MGCPRIPWARTPQTNPPTETGVRWGWLQVRDCPLGLGAPPPTARQGRLHPSVPDWGTTGGRAGRGPPETPGGGAERCRVGSAGHQQAARQPPSSSPSCPLPWSLLSPPGSPGSSMARECHPRSHRRCRRGRVAGWPHVCLCPPGCTPAIPIPALPAAAAGTASRRSPARLNPLQPASRRSWGAPRPAPRSSPGPPGPLTIAPAPQPRGLGPALPAAAQGRARGHLRVQQNPAP